MYTLLNSHVWRLVASIWHSQHPDRLGLQEVLNDAGIVPSTTKTYATSEIEDVLAKRWGAKPEVMCSCPHGNWRAMCDTAQIDSVSRAGLWSWAAGYIARNG